MDAIINPLFLEVNPIYFFVGFIVLAVAFMIFVDYHQPKETAKKIKKELVDFFKEREKTIKISDSHNKIFDFSFSLNETSYVFKIITVPASSEIVVQNKTSWQLNYGGGKRPGKTFPFKKPLPDINPFVLFEPRTKNVKYKKILIVYPNAHNLLKWVNESEMVIMDAKTHAYGIKVIRYPDLLEHFDLL